MRKITVSPAVMKKLYIERFHHPHPRVQLKMEAVHLTAIGFKPRDVCMACGISRWTLMRYLDAFREGGIDALKIIGYTGKAYQLGEFTQTIKDDFSQNPPRSVAEAASRIETLTGIKRKPTQIKDFMRRNGFKYRKVGHVPGKANSPEKLQEQELFLKEQLEPRLEEARQGKRAFFFWMPPTLSTARS
jgi:transposase